MGFLMWLESTAYAQWILTGLNGWPIMLTTHALGLAIAVGVIFVLDLRLLGLARQIPATSIHQLMSIAWIGIAANIFSGFSLFMTQASYYVTSVPFLFKIGCIIAGIVNLVYVQKLLKREAGSWQQGAALPQQGRLLAGSSLALWGLAVVTGRLIAYL
jgi:hypothetical protein